MNETPLAPMSWRDRIGIVAILTFLVAVLFHDSFKAEMVHFSSDGPLGVVSADYYSLPSGFSGLWSDLNWLGGSGGGTPPSFTFIMFGLLGPLGSAKFLAPVWVLSLGLAAAFCFRIFGFRPMVCLLGGIAAELNSNFFSNACWGVGTRCSALAATFLALAAIWSSQRGYRWLKLVLAGLATGMAVMEGADNGMIFSLFVAAFALFISLLGDGSHLKKVFRGVAMIAVVAVFAGIMAFQTVKALVGTQIVGIVGMEQTAESKEKRWHEATQWSLPKLEMLRVIIPGIFGYRMDTPEGGDYWGRVGEWGPDPRQGPRSSGAGEYAGVLVVLVAGWAVARSFSRKVQTYSVTEKKLIWFWAAMGFIAMLFAWGRHAPFYQLFYALPYMSTIRNPMKFMHATHMTLMILFAYGLQGMAREYLEKARAATAIPLWDKRWKYACFALVAASALAWFAYSGNRSALVSYMTAHFISPEAARMQAGFSVKEAGIFVLVLAICVAAVLALQAGLFRGPRAIWAGVVLGVILFGDFARANAPWIQYFDYKTRYESHPVIDLLKDKPWEHRVMMPPFRLNESFDFLQRFYHSEWLQHQFPYYNIQMMDMPQEPRMAADKAMYVKYVGTNILRYWQLTNTRYLFGVPGMADLLNRDLDPGEKRFRQIMAFALFQKPGTSFAGVQTNTTGPFSLNEFTGALPRAKLYSQWQVVTNSVETLTTLANPLFKPENVVLVNDEITAPAPRTASTNSGTVSYVSYAPKHIVQKTSSSAPGVLLLNDRHHTDWRVSIDGKTAQLLRCNFIVRGVQVPAGDHTVEWKFKPNLTAFKISLSALIFGLVLCGVTLWLTRRPRSAAK